MKRFIKTCTSVLLSASLILGFGVIPAKAADTPVDPAAFQATLAEVIAATKAVEAANPIKTAANVDLDIMSSQKVQMVADVLTNPENHVVKMAITSGENKIDTFLDSAAGRMYLFNTQNNRYEVAPSKASVSSATTVLENIDLTKLAGISTVTMGAGATIDTDVCKEIDIAVKAEGEAIATFKDSLMKVVAGFGSSSPLISSLFSGSATSSLIDPGSMDISTMFKGIDITVKAYFNDLKVLRRIDVSGSITINMMGMDIPVKVGSSSVASVTEEKVEVPAEYVTKAQLIEGVEVNTSGVTVTSKLKGKNTVFSVSGVVKSKAKTITIPATIKQLGKTYKICKAESGVFSPASKLKTLKIKDAALKKAVKKNPGKYGLSKKVKIK